MPQTNRPSWPRESIRAASVAAAATGLVIVLILVGSRRLAHFDAALVGYTFATLFATFGIAYRFTMWLQRPPTAMYSKRGWQVFFRPDLLGRNLLTWLKRLASIFLANSFIFRRGLSRGAAHWMVMWGCILASAITFPLVFGWIHFEFSDATFESYTAVMFGFPVFSFGIHSLLGYLIFHGLMWASFLVIGGVMIAMRRRMIGRDAHALQRFGEDFFPLLLLFTVSITGLMLVVSYKWMEGYAYEFLSITHAVAVIVMLLWLPFGKLFHIFQRPAQLGVMFYKDAGRQGEQAECAICKTGYASRMHVEDLIVVELQLGYRYEQPAEGVDHYQRVCPRCRRLAVAGVQSRLWAAERHSTPIENV